MELTELLLRLALAFLVLFIMTRIMGRKEISQMTFFNFVSAIAIGSITANLAVNSNLSIQKGIIAIVGWALFTIIMGLIDMTSKNARKITSGDPIIVIKGGGISEKALRKSRLDIDSLQTMLRQKNIFSIADVDYAIFETNGKLSVMPKENKKPATKMDVNAFMPPKIYPIPTEVITDGNILTKNLEKLKLDYIWIEQQLEQLGIQSISEVLVAQVQTDGSLFVDKKEEG